MNLTAALLERRAAPHRRRHRRPGRRLRRGQGGLPPHVRARQGRAAPAGHPDLDGADPGQLSRGARLPHRPGRLRAPRSRPGARRAGRPAAGPPGRASSARTSGDGSEALWKLGGVVTPTAEDAPGPIGAWPRSPRPVARAAVRGSAASGGSATFTYAGRRRRRPSASSSRGGSTTAGAAGTSPRSTTTGARSATSGSIASAGPVALDERRHLRRPGARQARRGTGPAVGATATVRP